MKRPLESRIAALSRRNVPGWAIPAVAILSSFTGLSIAAFERSVAVLALGSLVLAGTVLIAMRYERASFYLLILAIPFENVLNSLAINVLPGSWLIIPLLLALFIWLSHLAMRRTMLHFDPWTSGVTLAFAGWVTWSTIATGGFRQVLDHARSYYWLAVLFLLSQHYLDKERHLIEFGQALSISLGLVGACFAFGQFFAQTSPGLSGAALHSNAQHASAVLTVSGVLGMQLTKGIPFAWYFSRANITSSRTGRNLLRLSAALSALGTLAGISLNGVVGLVVTLGLMALMIRDPRRRTGAVFVTGALFVVLLLLPPFGERIADQVQAVQAEEPANWGTYRGLNWAVSSAIMTDRPLTGTGPDPEALTRAALRYMPMELVRRQAEWAGEYVFVPHNIYLGIGTQFGIPGLLLFTALVGGVTLNVWREVVRLREEASDCALRLVGQALFVGLAAAVVQGVGIPVYRDKILWLVLGSSAAFIRIARQHRISSPVSGLQARQTA